MTRALILALSGALFLAGCADTTAQNIACARQATPDLRNMSWGYYPGYGCGPVPPQVSTKFG